MKPTAAILTLLSFCLALTVSCAPQPVSRPWAYADLRLLDPPDNITPATDILAVYTRATRLDVDIRVDLLDINPGDPYTLKISLWDNRYFYQVPLVIDIPSSGPVRAASAGAGTPAILPRVIQDPWLDTVTVSLNRTFIGDHYHLDVATYTVNPPALADEAFDIRSDGLPPQNRAPLLLAFWDVFPAATPAQALRRWDGAHTGPLGERHGLKNILDGAGQYNLPVALLDIKNPASLAALDYLGGLPQLQNLNERGLLILPDVAYADPAEISLDFSRRAAAGFGLPASPFVYAASSDPLPGYPAQFIPLADASRLAASGGTRFIPLPAADALQATADGPALDVRRALDEAAFSGDSSTLVTLGGSLPNSTWGNSDMASPTFEWIASHPWIWVLTGYDLMTFPAGSGSRPPVQTKSTSSPWLDALQSAPNNPITDLAWQTYFTLTAPTNDEKLRALRLQYLGQVGELLAAADWAKNPTLRADCTEDLDADHQAECVLSNRKVFAILDPSGARLVNLFYLDDSGPHQLVGPSSQFTVGLSDPSEWHPERGEAADPSVIPGAFTDDTNPWTIYAPVITADGIIFTSPDRSRVKTYQLMENGIEVRYQATGPVTTRIPLVVEPQAFYSGPVKYQSALGPGSWSWGFDNGFRVEVRTDASLSADGFTSAFPFLSLPENPNLEYPTGTYFPFPLSVVTVRCDGECYTQITIK